MVDPTDLVSNLLGGFSAENLHVVVVESVAKNDLFRRLYIHLSIDIELISDWSAPQCDFLQC